MLDNESCNSIPSVCNSFSLVTDSGTHPALYSTRIGGPSPGDKEAGRGGWRTNPTTQLNLAVRLRMNTLTPPLQRICPHGELTIKGYFAFDLSPRHDALSSCDSKQALGGRSQHESPSDLGVWLREVLDLDEFLALYLSSNIFGVTELRAKRSVGQVAPTVGNHVTGLDVRVLTPLKRLTTASVRRKL